MDGQTGGRKFNNSLAEVTSAEKIGHNFDPGHNYVNNLHSFLPYKTLLTIETESFALNE